MADLKNYEHICNWLKPTVGKIAHPTQIWAADGFNPIQKLRRAGYKRHPSVVSFGYFSLDKQRKVSRSPVREPALKKPSR